VRRLQLICVGLGLCGWLAGTACADTFQLNEGRTLTGELVAGSANDAGLQFRLADGSYERVAWTSFSQEDLKKFKEDKKLAAFVEPFIEVSQEERLKRTEVKLNEPPRLTRPAPRSLLGAMFSSSVGAFVLLLLYAANIYAAYEISIFRARPIALVCGVSAVLPLIGPVLFLLLRPPVKPSAAEEVVADEPAQTFNVPKAPADGSPGESPAEATAGGLRIAHTETGPVAGEKFKAQVFQRGAFTFNRRFFETKFPGFFGVVRREAEKDLVMSIKSARGDYICQRVTRIAANDVHVQVQKGQASEEVMIPFSEIQEIQLKHKDA
jgi:hypothetical protein